MKNQIPLQKEINDIKKLSLMIRESNWMDDKTIIVNCSPDYSSIVCQILNHSLSTDNKHELYEQLYLEMPYPNMSQVWDRENSEYILYDKYIYNWVRKVEKGYKYLFVDSAVIRGKNFSKLRSVARNNLNFKLASLYLEESSIITPDFYVEKFSKKEGDLIFEWENPLNPNWK